MHTIISIILWVLKWFLIVALCTVGCLLGLAVLVVVGIPYLIYCVVFWAVSLLLGATLLSKVIAAAATAVIIIYIISSR